MSTTFPHTRKSSLGYNIEQVEDFLEEAKRAYTADRAELVVIDSQSIRRIAFGMQKGGYSPVHVDSALERLEDAFASRERERAIRSMGEQAWFAEARAVIQEIDARLTRPIGHRFDRVNFLTAGYSCKDVDRFADRLAKHLRDDQAISIGELRGATFRTKHGGYREAQVDLLIDSAVSAVLSIR